MWFKVHDLRGVTTTKSIPLIRLRNPHGNKNEWRGDWSDRYVLLTNYVILSYDTFLIGFSNKVKEISYKEDYELTDFSFDNTHP